MRNKIAFCCSADLDISVSAVALVTALVSQQTSDYSKVYPKHHERIENIKQLTESFSYYFMNGAAAEQSMVCVQT